MKKYIETPLAAVVISIALFYAVFTFASLYKQQISNQARYQCAQSSRYTSTNEDNNTQTWYPIEELYLKCLAEKQVK
jgi:YbbR domain-containing protein